MSPEHEEGQDISAATVAKIAGWMREHRDPSAPFDIVVEGVTDGTDQDGSRARVRSLAEAGATGWVESRWDDGESADTIRARIAQGPPRS